MRLPLFDLHRWAESFRKLGRGWNAFWFTPADPLVLGVQRIAAGLLLIYFLVATSPFLSDFYGPDAFIDQQTANEFRLENPITLPPGEWEAPESSTQRATRPEAFTKEGFPAPRPDEKRPPVLRPERLLQPREAMAYYQRWGMTPEFAYDEGMPEFSPFFHIKSHAWMVAVHVLGIVVAVLFTLGLFTRVTSVLAWVICLSYIHRVIFAVFGMDTMFAIALFYLMIAPSGAKLSLDRLVQRFRRSRYALGHPGTAVSLDVAPSVSANVALRLFQVHFCIIYFNSGIGKLQGAAWWNGTALWQTASNYEFTPDRFGFYTQGLYWLTQSRPIWELAMTSGVHFTLFLELGLPFLIWYKPWRPVLITGAVLLHTGIAMMMGLTVFSALMIVLVAGFLSTESVQRLLTWMLRGRSLGTLYVCAREQLGIRFAALVKSVDLYDQVEVVDVSTRSASEGGWSIPDCPQLVTPRGNTRRGYAMVEYLTRSLRLLWPLGLLSWVPGVGLLGRVLAPDAAPARPSEPAGVSAR